MEETHLRAPREPRTPDILRGTHAGFNSRAAWLSAGCAVLCMVLAVLQYRWIGEVSEAGQYRLRASLQSSLNRLSQDFDSEVAQASAALQATAAEVNAMGRNEAYALRYARWRASGKNTGLFQHLALAIPENGIVVLRLLDPERGHFGPAEWPESWLGLRDRMQARLKRGAPMPMISRNPTIFELPRFGERRTPGGFPAMGEQEWLVLELNLEYIRTSLIPELIQRYLASYGQGEYDIGVSVRADPTVLIYQSSPRPKLRIGDDADASVTLFRIPRPFRTGDQGPIAAPPELGPGQWQIAVRHRNASLEVLASRARRRNLILSSGILLLILTAFAAVIRFSRQAQRLAELQMNFVAGVSHELRTPLTVIRTAAYNLSAKVATNPAHVERYGSLIREESEKLTAIVEQVLQFASIQAGRLIREREPVAVQNVIEEGLQASRISGEGSRYVVEKHIESNLPLILADGIALKHAIQNLIDNAVKHGAGGNNWIGVFAKTSEDGGAIDIRVADRGPGIPKRELEQIFDPFFRGKRALRDQIHGTGLGLNLVKRIVEAHGGAVRVKSELMEGTEFTIRLPAAPPELQNEFAHSPG